MDIRHKMSKVPIKQRIKFNLRGTVIVTDERTIKSVPGSFLSSLDTKSPFYDSENNEFFFDRSPILFHHVLDYCRAQCVHLPANICPRQMKEELDFWGVPETAISKCCWKTFYQIDEEMKILDKLLETFPIFTKDCLRTQKNTGGLTDASFPMSNHKYVPIAETKKYKIWVFLNDPGVSKAAVVWHCILGVSIILSTLLFMLETLGHFREDKNIDMSFLANMTLSSKELMYFKTSPLPYIVYMELIFNSLFTIEWLARFMTCPNKAAFAKSILNITDIVSCIAIWFLQIIEYIPSVYQNGSFVSMTTYIGFFYTFRVLKMFRLAQRHSGMQILVLTVRANVQELTFFLLSFLCFTVTFAGFIYMAEIKSEMFSDFFISMWWSLITMTTVGYGDQAPSGLLGYLVGSACALIGIMLIALPVAITSSSFYEFSRFNKYRVWQKNKNCEKWLKKNNILTNKDHKRDFKMSKEIMPPPVKEDQDEKCEIKQKVDIFVAPVY